MSSGGSQQQQQQQQHQQQKDQPVGDVGNVADGTACVGDACLKRAAGLFALRARSLAGEEISLSAWRGMVMLVVNVASECGYTDRNYKELQALYDELKSEQFAVLAFPCNQFGGQEPGGRDQIARFVAERYQVTFPMFDKVDVNGPSAHPVYRFLKQKFPADIAWNFEKFLVDPQGQVVARYDSNANPMDSIRTDVLNLLKSASTK